MTRERCAIPVRGWACARPVRHRGDCWPMYQRFEPCGAWMRNVRERCARRRGHRWEHRSSYAMGNARGTAA